MIMILVGIILAGLIFAFEYSAYTVYGSPFKKIDKDKITTLLMDCGLNTYDNRLLSLKDGYIGYIPFTIFGNRYICTDGYNTHIRIPYWSSYYRKIRKIHKQLIKDKKI